MENVIFLQMLEMQQQVQKMEKVADLIKVEIQSLITNADQVDQEKVETITEVEILENSF